MGNSIRVTWDYIQGLETDLDEATLYGATADEIAELQHELEASRVAYAKNRGFTEPLPMCGVSQNIAPATDRVGNPVVYTKPVMLLIDDLSASAAEMFAAIMQDNRRALLYGYRTDGAGGSVGSYPAGIYSETGASIAQSILIRQNTIATTDYPSAPYIENIGVRPDKVDDYMTEDNLVNKGAAFVKNFLATMVEYINSRK